MPKKYESGPRKYIIAAMANTAIDTEESFIDALHPTDGIEPDKEAKRNIAASEALIRDFKRLKKTLLNGA